MNARRKCLDKQENRCFYCKEEFDSIITRNGKPLKLKLVWDHMVPYSYFQTNPDNNFVAACHVCNSIKSNKMFNTVEETIEFIVKVRISKGYF